MSDGLYEPVTRQKTYQLVADRLLRLIGTQELGPGDPLPSERELGRQYRVGRSSIREALARRHESDIDRMAREIEAMEASLASERAFLAADLRFHVAIAQACQNRLIVYLVAAMRTQVERSLASSVRVPGAPEHAIEMHRRILDAIAARNPGEARRQMHEHVARVERH